MRKSHFPSLVLSIMVLFCATVAQEFPDTLWIPVTFYDYRSNGSNPNFNACNPGSLVTGMVQKRLSPDRKPVLAANLACNDKLNDWFRPSGTNGADRNAQFLYDSTSKRWNWTGLTRYQNRPTEFVSATAYDPNYSMANIIIYDSLAFRHKGNGVYEFINMNGFFPLNGRGFGNESFSSNFSFAMELHHQFVYRRGLTFNFTGDDDVWVFVNDSLLLDLGGVHGPLSGSFSLDNVPGFIEGQSYRLSFFYCERHTWGSRIQVTTNIVAPVHIGGLKISLNNSTVIAGKTLALPAELFTDKGRLVPRDSVIPGTTQKVYDRITWELLPTGLQPGDNLAQRTGQQSAFSATAAFRFRSVVATYSDPEGKILKDTARIWVAPDDDYRVWIELTSRDPIAEIVDVMPRTYADSIGTNRSVSLIELGTSQQIAYAYAVVRDQYGNIKRAATNASWAELPPPGAITVSTTGTRLWEGILRRAAAGEDSIRTWEPLLIGDTVKVVVRVGLPTALRFVDSKGAVLDSVRISTDTIKEIRVEAIWSDNPGTWLPFSAAWKISTDSLQLARAFPAPATQSVAWIFDPLRAGSAVITVTAPTLPQITKALPIAAFTAPPSRVEFQLIDRSPRAGEPIRAVIRIYNSDGLIPGTWCYPGGDPGKVTYQDIIMRYNQDPRVVTGEDSGIVNLRPAGGSTVAQCFENGIDTAWFTLYYAPAHPDSLHQLFVKLPGVRPLEAATEPFSLMPGSVDKIAISTTECEPLGSTMILQAPRDMFFAVTCAWDRFGNYIAQVPSYWSTKDDLPPFDAGAQQIFSMDTKDVTRTMAGCLVAAAQENPNARDTICIEITPPLLTYHAVTGDTNGDGFLDRITLRFENGATVSLDSSDSFLITHTTGGTTVRFEVRSLRSASGAGVDSIWHLSIAPINAPADIPQTAWIPQITVGTKSSVASSPVKVFDGAGPVVWRAYQTIKDPDPTKRLNEVTVTLSELVTDEYGAPLKAGDSAASLFTVWRMGTSNELQPIPMFLASVGGIRAPTAEGNLTVIKFTTYDKDFTPDLYMSIRVDSTALRHSYDIVDAAQGNSPNVNNEPRRVVVHNSTFSIKAVPNPFKARYRQDESSTMRYLTIEQARLETKDAGTALVITFSPPSNGRNTTRVAGIEVALKIYDLAGNLVYLGKNDRVQDDPTYRNDPAMRSEWLSGTQRTLCFTWSGANDKNMLCSPGAYRAILSIRLTTIDIQTGETFRESIAPAVLSLGIRK